MNQVVKVVAGIALIVIGVFLILQFVVSCTDSWKQQLIQEQENAIKTQHDIGVLRLQLIQVLIDADGQVLDTTKSTSNLARVVMSPVRCLADNIYFESAWEPYEGKVAVAQVTMNRVHDPEYPKTVCGVVYFKRINPVTHKKEAAFSWTLGRKWRPRGMNHHVYEGCMRIAREVLRGKLQSAEIGPDVEYYHADYVHPRWADKYELVATIGHHDFYK